MVPNTFVCFNLCEPAATSDLRGGRCCTGRCSAAVGLLEGRAAGRNECRAVGQRCLCPPGQMKTIQYLVFNFNKFNIQNYMLKIKI